MDVKKTLTAINTFQNAADKNRAFLTMLQASADLWSELGTIRPEELQDLADAKGKLEKEIAGLTDARKALQADTKALQSTFDAKKTQILADFEDKRKAFEADHAHTIANLTQERNNLSAEISAMIASREASLKDLTAKEAKLEKDIAALRASLAQAGHALQ